MNKLSQAILRGALLRPEAKNGLYYDPSNEGSDAWGAAVEGEIGLHPANIEHGLHECLTNIWQVANKTLPCPKRLPGDPDWASLWEGGKTVYQGVNVLSAQGWSRERIALWLNMILDR